MTPAPVRETIARLRLFAAALFLSRPAKGRARVGCPVVAWVAGNRSSLETGRFASPLFDLCCSRIGFAIGDLVIAAADLSAVADSVVPVVAAGFAAVVGFAVDLAAIADFVDSAFVVCPSAAATGKERVFAPVAFSCEKARPSLEALDRLGTSLIPRRPLLRPRLPDQKYISAHRGAHNPPLSRRTTKVLR